MLTADTKLSLWRQATWSGYIYIAFLMVGLWALAGFFPSQPPSWSAEQITAVYRDNVWGIRIGMVLVLFGSMFYIPWSATLAKLISRAEGGPGLLTYCQLMAGTCNTLLTAYPAGWWLIASFRAERDPQIVQLLNDIGWLQFLGVISPYYFVVISIIAASLLDRDADPVIPRWAGWFNVWFLLTLIPLNVIFLFQEGPFAWNGLFGFYLPFVVFWIWFVVMTRVLRRALPRFNDPDSSS